ncbi:MAG: hypothetical protein ACI9TH_004010, partial [Kiritimatiellia bacterium]
ACDSTRRKTGFLLSLLFRFSGCLAEGVAMDLPIRSDALVSPLALRHVCPARGAGQPQRDPRPMDGVSLMPLIQGKMTERPRPIGFQSQGVTTLSDNRFKLVVSGGKGKKGKATADKVELYDLLADPEEKDNLIAQHPEVAAGMQRQLKAWVASCAHSSEGEDYK